MDPFALKRRFVDFLLLFDADELAVIMQHMSLALTEYTYDATLFRQSLRPASSLTDAHRSSAPVSSSPTPSGPKNAQVVLSVQPRKNVTPMITPTIKVERLDTQSELKRKRVSAYPRELDMRVKLQRISLAKHAVDRNEKTPHNSPATGKPEESTRHDSSRHLSPQQKPQNKKNASSAVTKTRGESKRDSMFVFSLQSLNETSGTRSEVDGVKNQRVNDEASAFRSLKRYKCSACQVRVSWKQDMFRHLIKNHGIKEPKDNQYQLLTLEEAANSLPEYMKSLRLKAKQDKQISITNEQQRNEVSRSASQDSPDSMKANESEDILKEISKDELHYPLEGNAIPRLKQYKCGICCARVCRKPSILRHLMCIHKFRTPTASQYEIMSQEEAALTLDGYERSLKEARIIKRAHLLAVTEAAEKVTAPVKSELPE